ncbi:MAG: hypothetical protein E6767_00140 [Dysgonomonas sp.]|nr:hypothetical protein [Dysgonomonas sp.]
MLQQRKKDFLQRLIEEFFKKLQVLLEKKGNDSQSIDEKKSVLSDCFLFFNKNFEVKETDEVKVLSEKIADNDLIEQYARLYKIEYDLGIAKDKESLRKALNIVEYLQNTDSTYSWDRTVLKEDLLRLLDESI